MLNFEIFLAIGMFTGIVLALVLAGVVGLNVYLYTAIDKGFMPEQDTGRISGFIRADQATSYQAGISGFTDSDMRRA